MQINEKNLTKYTVFVPIIGIFLVTSTIAYLFISDLKGLLKENLGKMKTEFVENKKNRLKQETKNVVDYINYYRKNVNNRLKKSIQSRVYEAETIIMDSYTDNIGKKSVSQIKKEVLETISKIRFNDGRGYYGVIDITTGKYLVHPSQKGKDSRKLFFESSKSRFDSFMEPFAKDDEGYVDIDLASPFDNGSMRKKIVFVRLVRLFNWIVFTGEYLEDIEYETQYEVLERVKKIRLENNGFFTVYNFQGDVVLDPAHPENEGENVLNLKSDDGISVTKEIIKNAKKENGGFTAFQWKDKTDGKKQNEKISFSMGIKEWNWVISTGQSLSEIEKELNQIEKEQLKSIEQKQSKFIIIGITAVLLSMLFSIVISKGINSVFSRYKKRVNEQQNKLNQMNELLEIRVREEVEKNRKKDELILQQSKLAIMGEMLTMIAHQWRQPLNVIGLTVQDLQDAYEHRGLDKNYLDNTVETTMRQLNYLSKTISDFSNFFSPNKELEIIKPIDVINRSISLANSLLEENRIKTVVSCRCDTQLEVYTNELVQIILNIITNAADEIAKREIEDGEISFEAAKDEEFKTIMISDNAGGISEEILDKVFEPYFSTKGAQGTGLGLYMAKIVIEKHMGGLLTAENINNGARFSIKLPIKRKNNEISSVA